MKNAVKLTILCVLTMSSVARAADAPKLVGEKEILTLDKNILYGDKYRGFCWMRLNPDGRRVLYVRKKIYKITRANGSQRDCPGYKFVLRDLKTGKDTAVPVPAMFNDELVAAWLSMTVFDPTGKTLIVPAGQDGNKNGLMEKTESCKVGLYDIASGKLKTLDVESNVILPTFHPDGKTLVVVTIERFGVPTSAKIRVTPTDKIKFRTLSKAGLIRSISPTSDLMAMLFIAEGEGSQPGDCVLYDLKTDTVKARLAGRNQSHWLMQYNLQWTADGRYVYQVMATSEQRQGRIHTEPLTRIWDAKAGKKVSALPGVMPVGPGPGKGTMVLVRIPTRPQSAPKEQEIVLHAQDDKTLGQGLHPLGDKSIRPISTQGKWVLFIREDANRKSKVFMAEIVLPTK